MTKCGKTRPIAQKNTLLVHRLGHGPPVSRHIDGVLGLGAGKTMVAMVVTDKEEIGGIGRMQGRLQ